MSEFIEIEQSSAYQWHILHCEQCLSFIEIEQSSAYQWLILHCEQCLSL